MKSNNIKDRLIKELSIYRKVVQKIERRAQAFDGLHRGAYLCECSKDNPYGFIRERYYEKHVDPLMKELSGIIKEERT